MSSKTLSIFALFSTLVVAGCGGGGGSSSGGGGSIPSTGGGTSPSPAPSAAASSSPTSTPSSAPATIGNSNAAPIALYLGGSTSNSQVVGQAPPSGLIASQPQAAGAPVDGIPCITYTANAAAQVHLHMSLYVNGMQVAIPTAISLKNPILLSAPYFYETNQNDSTSCNYAPHTHEPDGTIYVDGTNALTLGQFFDVWGANLSTSGASQGFNANGFTAYSGQTRIFLTDESTGNPGSYSVKELSGIDTHNATYYTLKAHQEYTIEVGAPFVNTPNYSFGSGLQ